MMHRRGGGKFRGGYRPNQGGDRFQNSKFKFKEKFHNPLLDL